MRLSILPYTFILAAAVFLPGIAKAASASTIQDAGVFSFTYQDQTFPVDRATLDRWRNTVTLPSRSLLVYPAANLKNDIARFAGLKVPATRPTVAYTYDPVKIYQYVKRIAATINTPVQEPTLTIEGDRATQFTPPREGLALQAYEATMAAARALERGRTSAELTATTIKPTRSLAELNSLGIQELVAEGTSTFNGSPKNRRVNIKVGVEKMKGIILKPGQEFSFNDNLGPVDGEHGFLPELVIKKSGTIPEFGGGLCQVSSTTFRAAMNAGLPITERRNHAYAVQYYAPQGTDATIYPGIVDLKFINDTPGALLIWPHFKDDNTLVFDFYGTKDSRQVTLEKPVQYDKKSDGSMKATWTRIVEKDGITSTSTFKSVYQPPALFHKTEEFAKPTSTLATELQLQIPANSSPAAVQ